jgi:hypothetical protein
VRLPRRKYRFDRERTSARRSYDVACMPLLSWQLHFIMLGWCGELLTNSDAAAGVPHASWLQEMGQSCAQITQHDGVELEDKRSSEARSHSTAIDSFYPLTMPLTVGPGSIAVAIGLGSQRGPKDPLHYRRLRYSADRLSRGSSHSRLRSMFVTASPSVQPPC